MASDTNGNPPAGVTPDELEAIREQARHAAENWPPLTDDQRGQLAVLLAPVTAGGTR